MNDPGAVHTRRIWKPLLPVFFLAVVLGLPGCQSVNPLPGFGLAKTAPEENRIRESMRWHSAKVEVYKDFRTVFTARSVYVSDEIRKSIVEWEARTRLMSPDEREEFFHSTYGEDKNVHQVLLGFYTPDSDMNNLDQEKTRWTAYIEGPEGAVVKAGCFEVDDEQEKMYMRFLEWDLSWSRLYLLCFDTDSLSDFQSDGWIKLVISGPTGQGELRLRVDPPQR